MDQQQILDAHPKLKAYKLVSIDSMPKLFRLNGSLDVEFIYSVDTFMLMMAEDQKTLDAIEYTTNSRLLEVGMKANSSISISGGIMNIFSSGSKTIINGQTVTNHSFGDSKIVIGMPSIPDLELHGSGDISSSAVSQDRVNLVVQGSGDAKLTGRCMTANLFVQGSGDINCKGLVAVESIAKVQGSGDISCYAETTVNATVQGSGDITVFGNPPLKNTHVQGSGDIRILG